MSTYGEHSCDQCFRSMSAHGPCRDCEGSGSDHFPRLCCPGCGCGSFEEAHPAATEPEETPR